MYDFSKLGTVNFVKRKFHIILTRIDKITAKDFKPIIIMQYKINIIGKYENTHCLE